jgi:hypothetical protein
MQEEQDIAKAIAELTAMLESELIKMNDRLRSIDASLGDIAKAVYSID